MTPTTTPTPTPSLVKTSLQRFKVKKKKHFKPHSWYLLGHLYTIYDGNHRPFLSWGFLSIFKIHYKQANTQNKKQIGEAFTPVLSHPSGSHPRLV